MFFIYIEIKMFINVIIFIFAGTYGCVIISSGIPTLKKSLLNTNFSLHVFSGNVLSKPLKIPFLPAIFVHSRLLNLSDARMGNYLTVSGRPDILKQVQVRKNIISVLDSIRYSKRHAIS